MCADGCDLVMVAFICFLCPGMFNALNGMGGGGLLDKNVCFLKLPA